MQITLIYGTNTSGTYEAARLIAEELTAKKHTVRLVHARAATALQVKRAEALIFGSCTWESIKNGVRTEGELQQDFARFAAELGALQIPGKRVAIFALGDKNYTHFCNAAVHLEKLTEKIGAKIIIGHVKTC